MCTLAEFSDSDEVVFCINRFDPSDDVFMAQAGQNLHFLPGRVQLCSALAMLRNSLDRHGESSVLAAAAINLHPKWCKRGTRLEGRAMVLGPMVRPRACARSSSLTLRFDANLNNTAIRSNHESRNYH